MADNAKAFALAALDKVKQLSGQLSGKADAGHTHDELQTVAGIAAKVEKIEAESQPFASENTKTARALRAAIDGKADKGHAHNNTERRINAIAAKVDDISGRINDKSDASHSHADIDNALSDLRQRASRLELELKSKASEQHGEHITRAEIRNMIPSAKDGESVIPLPSYSEGQQVPRLAIVRIDGSTWLSTKATRSTPPSADWMLIAKDGSNSFFNAGAGSSTVQFDDYDQAEYLDEQEGDGTVKAFTFSAPVQLVEVELISTLDETLQVEAVEGRATFGAIQPSATRGAVLKHEQAKILFGNGKMINVLAPADTRINVYGMRRKAA